MATGKALNGKPYAGNPHVQFDEGEVAPAATPRRGSILYKLMKNVQDTGTGRRFGASFGRAALAMIVFSVAMASAPSGAAEIKWTGGAQTGSMAEGANWGGIAPGSGDTAVVYGNTAAAPAITPDGGATYAGLWVSNYGDGYVLQTNGVVTVTGNDGLRIGRCSGYTGHYTVTNGTLKATAGTMYVGCYGATGVLKVSGDGIVEAPNFSLAVKGPAHAATKTKAYLDVSENARVCVVGSLRVGYEAGGNGYCAEVRQSGGVVSSKNFYLAYAGKEDKYIQTGGTNAVSAKAYIGGQAGSAGTYTLDGGVFSVTNWLNIGGLDAMSSTYGAGTLSVAGTGVVDARSDLRVGSNGPGTLELDGGAVKVSGVAKIGVNATGVATMDTGALFTSGGNFQVGHNGNGTFNMNGGILTVGKQMWVGATGSGTGTFNLSDGAITVAEYMDVGYQANGVFVQSGGSVLCKDILYLGQDSGKTGFYTMTGGTFEVADKGFLVGNKGTGVLDVSGSAVMTIKGNLNLGFESTGKGTLKLHDGGKIIANHVKEYKGTAVLAQFDGGTLRARQADDVLKNLANIELKSGGLALETAGFNLGITNCVFNVTPGGKISVSGGGTVTFKADTSVNLSEKPTAAFVFAETNGEFAGMPALADGRGWKMLMAPNRKSIRIVPPGLTILIK